MLPRFRRIQAGRIVLAGALAAGVAGACGAPAPPVTPDAPTVELSHRPEPGVERSVAVGIYRQGPAGLVALEIEGRGRVAAADGDQRTHVFAVERARVRENGRSVQPEGALGALASMEGLELRWVTDARGNLRGTPEVHGGGDPDASWVPRVLLDDLVQFTGTFPAEPVPIGGTWTSPWHLHSLDGQYVAVGELRSRLDGVDAGLATIALDGSVSLPRDETRAYTVVGEGSARGASRVALASGETVDARLEVELMATAWANGPDGWRHDIEATVELRLWRLDLDGVEPPPAGPLARCDQRLQELSAGALSATPEAEDLAYGRPTSARPTWAEGRPLVEPGVVVRVEPRAVFVAGHRVNVEDWLAEPVGELTPRVVYLDVAPEVTLARLRPMVASLRDRGEVRLLVSPAEEAPIDWAAQREHLAEVAGDCAPVAGAADLAAGDEVLDRPFVLTHAILEGLGVCRCEVADLEAVAGILTEARLALHDRLRWIAWPEGILGAPGPALARDLPARLAGATPADPNPSRGP